MPLAKRWWFWAALVLVVVVIVAGVAVGSRNNSNSSGTPATHGAAVAGTSTTAAHRPTVTAPSAPPSTTTTIKNLLPTAFFNCSGSAPGGVTITYGTNSSGRAGGTSLPWQAYLPVTSNIQFFDVTAQFHGPDGNIRCTTLVYVNGTSVTQTGTASSNSDVASAKVCSNAAGGWRPC